MLLEYENVFRSKYSDNIINEHVPCLFLIKTK